MNALSKRIAAAVERDIPERVEPVTLTLPMPPSTNELYRNTTAAERSRMRQAGKPERPRCATERYLQWQRAAGTALNMQRVAGQFRAPVVASLLLERRKGRADLDNTIKATCDLLVKQGLLKDDSLIVGYDGIWWSDTVKGVEIKLRLVEGSGTTRARVAA